MSEALRQRIRSPGPKRILSLDGGGIRGLITLGFLEKIEDHLKARLSSLHLYDRPPTENYFRLRDYYDLIGGTSTGAIIASALAVGLSVRQIIELYLDLGTKIFSHPNPLSLVASGAFARKFSAEPLRAILKNILQERTLGDASITTGLCIVAKRYDTNSVWAMVNAPESSFYDFGDEPNRNLPLAQIVRASTAAPSYFDSERLPFGNTTYGFIDGGMSMHNNPALKLLLVATVPDFGFRWPVGVDNLSITSIGTGEWSRKVAEHKWIDGTLPLSQVGDLLSMFMEDASELNETILQAVGVGTNRRKIDSVIGLMDGTLWGQSLLRYERFQAFLEDAFFMENDLAGYVARIPLYRQMDNVTVMQDLLQIGRILATRQIGEVPLP